MLSLADLARHRRPGGAVCTGPQRDWDAFARARDLWRDALPSLAASSGRTVRPGRLRRAAIHFEGAFDFAAALAGAWAAGFTAVVPGDATDATASALVPETDVLLGDFPGRFHPWREPPEAPAPNPKLKPPAEPFPDTPLVIHTSGTTGKPLAVEKTVADLENEIATLEAAFGTALRGARLLATVGHQHIYGLLFRLLWPLAAGRPFPDRPLRYPEELAEEMSRGGAFALVASPAFLRRMGEAPVFAGLADPAPASAVFSSGGPLSFEAAGACARLLGRPPWEIYGSSETGGVAWRLRESDDEVWTPFPGVAVAEGKEEALVVARSPHMSRGTPFPTADRVGLAEGKAGGFRLLGRADRIVKLEEKRLSLAAMEERLRSHPAVADARLLVLPGARDTLAAVLRMESSPIPVRGTAARADLIASLRAHLLGGFERILLPRRWRLVRELPVNALGKTARTDLEALFRPQRGPVILAARRLPDGAAELDLDMPPELEYFRGHFPEAPLLPGVVQLDWALREGARLFGPFGPFRGLRSLKFRRPIAPGLAVRLTLAWQAGRQALHFRYDSALGDHAAGFADFGPHPAEAVAPAMGRDQAHEAAGK